jgi:hypothetical protein
VPCLIVELAIVVLLVFVPGNLIAELDRRKKATYLRVD